MIISSLLFAAAVAQPFARSVHVPLPNGFHPDSMATGDFNGDGKIDVALCGHSQQLLVLAGDGRGGLHALPQEAQCGANPTFMIATDLFGRHRSDLVISNHDTDYLTILANDGKGHFTAQQVRVHSNPHPHTVAAADFNNDAHADLITDSWAENRLTLVLSNGHGGWQTPGTPIEIGRKPYINVVAADLDGDGNVDLVMPNTGLDSICILFGDGHGHFTHAGQSPLVAGPTPFMVAVADVNGDGRPDIVVANYSGHISDTTGDGLTWVRNDGGRHFTAFPQRIAIGQGCWRVAAGDINGDGIADIAFIDAARNAVTVVYGSHTGLHAGVQVPVMQGPHNLALADLDGDGRADLMVITEERDELLVLLTRR
jgi:FG-GAP-like repeat